MTDEAIIKEAVKLVNDGISVTFPVKGRSMIPFIIGGKESVILQRSGTLRPGLIVLAEVAPSRYVLHRIIKIEPDGGQIILMGDGNVRGTETCQTCDVMARATHVVDGKGRKRSLESASRMFLARLWKIMLPIRRYLLAILRRINKKYA